MLPTTTEFDAAVDANTTEVDCKVEIEREYNAIADTVSVSAVHDPVDPRFHKENVLNIDNPRGNGIAYGPLREMFTSTTPVQAFRLIASEDFDEERDIAYYIPENSSNNTRADITVDYSADFNMNALEVRYENSRSTGNYYDDTINLYITPNGGGETLVYSGAMKTDGVTRIYWDGSSWSESKVGMDPDGTPVREVRLRVAKGTYTHQPRIMYLGGIHVVDASDDIIDASVRKTEFEASTYLPHGEPSGNSCDITLDNTQKRYRFGDNISRNYFLKDQKITVQFGVNTKYGGGADSFEYVSGGVFYIDDYGYEEEEMIVNISGQDSSKKLQEVMCGNYLWVNKSLKFIVYDVLARSGISPIHTTFDFGIAANVNESNKRAYTWSHEEQTVWDFLSQLAKSEMGTVYYDEEDNLVFTDRLEIDNKVTAGIQQTFDASVNLEKIDESFEVGANRIKVNYEELAPNYSNVNFNLTVDGRGTPSYEEAGPVPLNQVLWQPDADEGYLGSAILSRTLRPNHSHIYVSSDTALQITRDEGEVLIGDEFITYDNFTTTPGSGEGKLRIVNRDNRKTVFNGQIPIHKGWYSDYNLRLQTYFPHSLFSGAPSPARRVVRPDGLRQYKRTRQSRYKNVVYLTEAEKGQIDWSDRYRVHTCRFRFNEIGGNYRKDQAAGIYINQNRDKRAIFFEVSNPNAPEMVRDSAQGNVRAYKIDHIMGPVPMPPVPPTNEDDPFKKYVPFDEASSKNDGTYIEITVIQTFESGVDNITWYVNGELVGNFSSRYSYNYLIGKGYTTHQAAVGNDYNERGRFGFFTRGSTDATLDFIYATNDTRIGADEVLQSRGFRKYFDSHNSSWGVKKDYINDLPYYVEFGAPVHEVVQYDAKHDTYPNMYSRVMNTNDRGVSVFKATHNPFSSSMIVANTDRIGINLNDTVFYEDGSTLDHSFLVYGLSIVRTERDSITTSDAASIRRYGIEEVEIDNPWINSKAQAISIGKFVRKFWSQPQQFFNLEVMPNPALQVRDRVGVLYSEKGFDNTGVWFVNGITIRYDGGLSSTVNLKRYEDYPTGDRDYREEGGVII